MVAKTLLELSAAILGILFVSAIFAPLLYLSWNYGVAPAITVAEPVTVTQCLCLSIFLAIMSNKQTKED